MISEWVFPCLELLKPSNPAQVLHFTAPHFLPFVFERVQKLQKWFGHKTDREGSRKSWGKISSGKSGGGGGGWCSQSRWLPAKLLLLFSPMKWKTEKPEKRPSLATWAKKLNEKSFWRNQKGRFYIWTSPINISWDTPYLHPQIVKQYTNPIIFPLNSLFWVLISVDIYNFLGLSCTTWSKLKALNFDLNLCAELPKISDP